MARRGQWGGISLHDAAADGRLDLIKSRLGASWTNVNAQDSDKNSAIHEAARWGHVEIIAFLAENGGDVNLKNKQGQTALHIAASQGRDAACKSLVALGCNVNEGDDDGDTPLITAAGRDQLTTITTLLALGADKAIKNQRGKDAAMLAASPAATERVKARPVVSPS